MLAGVGVASGAVGATGLLGEHVMDEWAEEVDRADDIEAELLLMESGDEFGWLLPAEFELLVTVCLMSRFLLMFSSDELRLFLVESDLASLAD